MSIMLACLKRRESRPACPNSACWPGEVGRAAETTRLNGNSGSADLGGGKDPEYRAQMPSQRPRSVPDNRIPVNDQL